jgi:hypothetical protein
MKLKALACVGVFVTGVAVGGYLFAESQPRSFVAVSRCHDNCYRNDQLLGLLASAGIQRVSAAVPFVTRETDRCLAVRMPRSSYAVHYVVFPKRDIKDIADIAVEDQPFVLDCLDVIRSIVKDDDLKGYRVITNGSGMQDIAYLHFHIVVEKEAEQG